MTTNTVQMQELSITDERLLAAFNSGDSVLDGLHEVGLLFAHAFKPEGEYDATITMLRKLVDYQDTKIAALREAAQKPVPYERIPGRVIDTLIPKMLKWDNVITFRLLHEFAVNVQNEFIARIPSVAPTPQEQPKPECHDCAISPEGTHRDHCPEAAARAQQKTDVQQSLLREPISATNPLPLGCYCQLGKCTAPVIMGRQTPCRDPAKRAAGTAVQPVKEANE